MFSSPPRPFGWSGDFFLASFPPHRQLHPALLLLHLRQPLCSCVFLFSQHPLSLPLHPLRIFDATWTFGAQTGPHLDCRCGCDGDALTVCPPTRARVWPWRPNTHANHGGDVHFYDFSCSPWTRRAPTEAWLDPKPLLRHRLLLGRHVREVLFACAALQRGGVG